MAIYTYQKFWFWKKRPRWKFAFQAPTRIGGKPLVHPKKHQLSRVFFSTAFNVYTYVITEKELEWKIKNKGDEFRWNNSMKIFLAAVRKWEMLATSRVKVSGSEKKKAKKNFVHKTCTFFFRLLDPLIFLPFSLLQSFSITRFHFLFE